MANKAPGSLVVLSVGTGESKTKIALQTEGSFNATAETEDVSTKDDADSSTGMINKQEEVTGKSAEISCTYQIAENGTNPLKEGEKYGFSFAGAGISHTGTMLVKSVNESYPLNGKVTIQISATTVGSYT